MMACAAGAGHAQSKLSPDARRLLAERASAPTRTASAAMVQAYVTLAPGGDAAAVERLGCEVNLRSGRLLTARIPVGALADVASLPDVAYVQTATPVAPMMDVARPAGRVDLVQQGEGLAAPFTGNGVVVGIIDSGFDYTHPNFYNGDRTELRIRRVWEQGTATGTPPEGFSYGSEFDTEEEILAAAGDVSTNSHGTHVAGIAAGADRSLGDYHGVAPDADIVLVSMSGADTETNVNISDAIAYIYAYAESVGKPCVINMSLGTQVGPHDGTSTFDVLSDAMQGPGRLLVGSMGNFGGGNFHATKAFAGTAADTLRTFVDFKNGLSASAAGGVIDIWGEPGMELKVNVFTYRTFISSIVDSFSVSLPAATAPGRTESLSGASGTIAAYGEVSPLNNRPHVMLTSAITGLRGGHVLGFEVVSSSAGRVSVWADGNSLGLTSGDLDGWTEGDDLASPAEIGGTGHNVISVGAYVTRNEFETENSGTMNMGETVGDIASFSCVGPTADGRMKPDISAPGCAIASSASSNYSSIASLPIAGYYEWNDRNYYYAYMQGTSMSAPFVTGVLATWLEANSELDPAGVRSILASTAITDDYTGSIAGVGDNTWGYGKIDAWAGIRAAIDLAAGISDASVGASSAISVSAVGGNRVRIEAQSPCSGVAVTVFGTDGAVRMQRNITASEASSGAEISLGGLAPGVYLVKAASDSHTETAKVSIN